MRDRQVPHFFWFLAKFLGFNRNFPEILAFSSELRMGPDYWRDFVFYLRLEKTGVFPFSRIFSFGGYCTGDNYKDEKPIDVFVLNTSTLR